jgi:hypothetical protein
LPELNERIFDQAVVPALTSGQNPMEEDAATPGSTASADSDLAKMVMGYLRHQPEVMDSLEGIAQWWLSRQRIRIEVTALSRALKQLVAEGKLEAVGLPDRQLYRMALPSAGALHLAVDPSEMDTSENADAPAITEEKTEEGSFMTTPANPIPPASPPGASAPASPAAGPVAAVAAPVVPAVVAPAAPEAPAPAAAPPATPTLQQQLDAMNVKAKSLATTLGGNANQKKSYDSSIKDLQSSIAQKKALAADWKAKIAAYQTNAAAMKTFASQTMTAALAGLSSSQTLAQNATTTYDGTTTALNKQVDADLETAVTSSEAAQRAADAQRKSGYGAAQVTARATLDTRRATLTAFQTQINAAQKVGDYVTMYFLATEITKTLDETITDPTALDQQLETTASAADSDNTAARDTAVQAAADQQTYNTHKQTLAAQRINRRSGILALIAQQPATPTAAAPQLTTTTPSEAAPPAPGGAGGAS